ncbi:helix-turn-helix domain-containing protein [Amycolatopsis nigrescens]|uniref:helix-turn-helix domain-containing protein n=1 Tax=Amycolatopsis nigrescens TaxID=381445 RepID=UPI00037638E7|nr:helix-turn-helix transcriptional regulator [Amycolatopsis nigrescens]
MSERPFYVSLGGELRLWRGVANLRQLELVRAVGTMSHSAYCRYETGARPLAVHRLMEICVGLDVDPGFVLHRAYRHYVEFHQPPDSRPARLPGGDLDPMAPWPLGEPM